MSNKNTPVTIKDVARAAGVSFATVSRVLNETDYPVREETKEKVLSTAKELGYVPNLLGRYFKTQRSDDIGVLVPNLSNPLYVEAIKGLEQVLAEQRYNVLFASSERSYDKEESILNNFLAKKVCGVIVLDIEGHEALLQKMANQGIAIAVLSETGQYDFPLVHFSCDLKGCAYIATEYMLQKGRQRIAYFSGPLNRTSRRQLLAGYEQCFMDYGIPINPELICVADTKQITAKQNFEYDYGYQMALQLLKKKIPFDAVVSGNDMTAIGAMEAIRQAGLDIPWDVSVMGIDNTLISSVVGLSTVEIFFGKTAVACANGVIQQLSGENIEMDHVFHPCVIRRGTTA